MKTNYHKANQSTSLSNPYLNNNFIPRSGQVSEGNNSTQREYAWQVASNLLVSVRYAWAGVCYAFVSQRNFRIHTLITLVAISWGLFLRVMPWKWRLSPLPALW